MGNARQYALIAYLADFEGGSGRLGKKAVQKLVHILTSITGRSYGYQFSFYTYGPFSRSLASDLDIAQALGLLNIEYDNMENSYSVKSTEKARDYIEKFLTEELKEEACGVWREFSGRTAKELELISTIFFIHDEEGIQVGAKDMACRVRELKPKYNAADISKAQNEILLKFFS